MFSTIDTSFEGSEDWTRLEFYKYIRTFLSEVEFFIQSSSEQKLAPLVQEYNKWIEKEEEERFIKDDTLNPDEDPELETKKKSKKTPTKSKQSQQNEESKGEKEEEAPEDSQLDKIDKEQLIEIQKLRNKGANTFSSKKELMGVLKLELKNFKQSNHSLKKYGAEWINEWIKTRNFHFWLKDHHKVIGDRSTNNPHASNHFYYAENGNIYFGDLSFGRKQGKGQYVDRSAKTVYLGQWEEDEMSGEGSLASLAGGDFLYDGNFKNNRLEGMGKWIRGKQKYVGRFHK
jgi:ATPase subunit of ABC transporter with duplicated ATPase domains